MTYHTRTPADDRSLPVGHHTTAAFIPPDTDAAGFSFIGKLADHMDRKEAEIKSAMLLRRSDHGEVKSLERKLQLLKARCAALGNR